MKILPTIGIFGLVLLVSWNMPVQAKTLVQTIDTQAQRIFTTSLTQVGEETELQGRINALMGELVNLQSGSPAANIGFSEDLSLGSSGLEVITLQQFLVSRGHLAMPEGVPMGYFGELTRRAVAAWQVEMGIKPASGYWGPLSRSHVGETQDDITVGGTVSTATTFTTVETIRTPGMEGTLYASLALDMATTTATATTTEEDINNNTSNTSAILSLSNDVVRVLDIEFTASSSDIKVERIQVNLGKDNDIYRDIVARIHIMEGDDILASRDLDKITVIENHDDTLFVTVSGMSLIVRNDAPRVITIAVEARHSLNTLEEESTWTLTIPAEGIRGVDGTGANVYASEAEISQSFEVEPPTPEDPEELSDTETSDGSTATTESLNLEASS